MKFTIEHSKNTPKTATGMAAKVKEICEAAPFGTMFTTRSIAEKLGFRSSSIGHTVADIPGNSILKLVNGRWLRLFGSAKTIREAAKE